ncbi:1928_t:CDS:2, partial [Acaulospora colombiana]
RRTHSIRMMCSDFWEGYGVDELTDETEETEEASVDTERDEEIEENIEDDIEEDMEKDGLQCVSYIGAFTRAPPSRSSSEGIEMGVRRRFESGGGSFIPESAISLSFSELRQESTGTAALHQDLFTNRHE